MHSRATKKVVKTRTSTEFYVEDIRVILKHKAVKNINFRVKAPDGRVEVSAPVWIDEACVRAHILKKSTWIYAQQEKIRKFATQNPSLSAAELDRAKQQLAQKADPYFAYWEPLIGVRSKKRAYREMSSRWGSCNPHTGRICLNTHLLDFPDECLEYVIVHELCHLIEANHGSRFKALMDRHMPDWRDRRKRLRS